MFFAAIQFRIIYCPISYKKNLIIEHTNGQFYLFCLDMTLGVYVYMKNIRLTVVESDAEQSAEVSKC